MGLSGKLVLATFIAFGAAGITASNAIAAPSVDLGVAVAAHDSTTIEQAHWRHRHWHHRHWHHRHWHHRHW